MTTPAKHGDKGAIESLVFAPSVAVLTTAEDIWRNTPTSSDGWLASPSRLLPDSVRRAHLVMSSANPDGSLPRVSLDPPPRVG